MLTKQLTLGSLFNGIAGWILAAERNGVKTLWEAEIDEYCDAVTKHHFPDVKQLGDITKINGAEIEPVDIICSGSPCQSFSTAGKHTGLDGVSGIFYEFVRVVKEMQDATNGIYPKFVVWENVPGAFSSNNGEDIQAVLNAFDDLGYVLDMNILDAQYMGVPQRRRRIFAVWQSVNSIRQMRTNTSFSIITQCLTEILLCTLNEALSLSEKGQKDSDWKQRKLSEDGLLKKMKLFGIVEKPQFEKLLKDWEGTLRKLLQEQGKLDALLDEKDEPAQEGMTKSELIQQLDEELFGNIDMLWKQFLADLYKKEISFTTLTATSEITEQTICTCSKILESINWLTIRLPKLSENFYETERFILTARKELIKYANERQGGISLFEGLGWVQCWDDYFPMVSDQRQLFIANIREQTRREILFERESVSGHTSESEGTRKGSSESTGNSTDSTGKCVAYSFDSVSSNSMKSANPYSGCREVDKAGTLDTTQPNPAKNQGGIAIHSYSIAGNTIGRKFENGGNGKGVLAECSYTLNTTDRHAVFREGSFGSFVEDTVAGTSKASGGVLSGGVKL